MVARAVTGTASTGGTMIRHVNSARRRGGLAIVVVASLAAAGLAAGTSYASGSASGAADTAQRSTRASVGHTIKDTYVDVTDQGGRVQTQELRAASRVARQPPAGSS